MSEYSMLDLFDLAREGAVDRTFMTYLGADIGVAVGGGTLTIWPARGQNLAETTFDVAHYDGNAKKFLADVDEVLA